MDEYTQIATMIGAFLGVISFIMYFPLKKKEINTKIENENVEVLSKVVHDLQDELERKNIQEQVDKKRIDGLDKRISNLEDEIKNNDIAFSAITLCGYYKNGGKCPILIKKNEMKL